MKNVEMSGIMISKERFLADYSPVHGEAFQEMKVGSVSREIPVLDRSGEQVEGNEGNFLTKHIINLKAIPSQHTKTVQDLWKGRETIDIAELRGLTVSVNAIVPPSGELKLPFNGQTIGVQTGYVTNNAGEQVLVGKAFTVPQAAKATGFNLEEEVIETPEEVEA